MTRDHLNELSHERAAIAKELGKLYIKPRDHAAIAANKERDLIVIFARYADWLATVLWRQVLAGNPLGNAARELPDISENDKDTLCVKCNVNLSVLDWLLNYLKITPSTKIPGVGRIEGGTLIPEPTAVQRWANNFRWIGFDLK